MKFNFTILSPKSKKLTSCIKFKLVHTNEHEFFDKRGERNFGRSEIKLMIQLSINEF